MSGEDMIIVEKSLQISVNLFETSFGDIWNNFHHLRSTRLKQMIVVNAFETMHSTVVDNFRREVRRRVESMFDRHTRAVRQRRTPSRALVGCWPCPITRRSNGQSRLIAEREREREFTHCFDIQGEDSTSRCHWFVRRFQFFEVSKRIVYWAWIVSKK